MTISDGYSIIKNSRFRFAIFSFLIILLISTNVPIVVNAYNIRSHDFCKDVDMSGHPLKPIQPTSTFYSNDEKVILLVVLQNVDKPHNTFSRWYDPDGKLFDTIVIDISDPKKEGYDYWNFFSLFFEFYVNGTSAEELPGQWRVEFYIDDKFEFEDYFEIKAGSEPLDLKVVVSIAEVFQVGEEVVLSLYVSRATDEGYLKLTGPYTLSDDVGSFPAESYVSYRLGVADKGDVGTWQITFSACFSSGGQKYCDSDTATFKVVSSLKDLPPDLAISLKPDRSSASIGDVLSVDASLINNGNGKAVNINFEISSDKLEIVGGPESWNLASLDPGASSDVIRYDFKVNGPVGEGKITFLATCFDERGREYQRTEVITVQITPPITITLVSLHDADKLSDYLQKIKESPYPVRNNVEVVISGEETVKKVILDISGADVDKIELKDVGGGRFQADVIPFGQYSSEEFRDYIWLIMRNIAKFSDQELPSPNWNWREPYLPSPRIEEITVTFEDGTEVKKRVNLMMHTILDSFLAKGQTWGRDGTFIVGMSERKPPVDLLVRNPQGLTIGTNIDKGGKSEIINTIQDSFYSGKDSNPQLVYIPQSPGDLIVKAFGNGDGNWDLLVFNAKDHRGSTKVMRSLQATQGSVSEYKTTISDDGVVENLEAQAALPWLQSDNSLLLLIAIPIIAAIIVIFLFKRKRRVARSIPSRTPDEVKPPQTIPEEIPEGR